MCKEAVIVFYRPTIYLKKLMKTMKIHSQDIVWAIKLRKTKLEVKYKEWENEKCTRDFGPKI
jgi:hypothetical protein